MPHRPRPVEIEILRNGKSSESVSFVNEAAANFDGTSKPSHKAAAPSADDDTDADAGTAPETTVASAPEPDHHDLVSPMAPVSPVAPAASHAPTPKTIDIP
jgi:hypothetical protein